MAEKLPTERRWLMAASGIEELVCRDIEERQRRGIAKYGKTVAANPLQLRQWLQHAYEEALDLAVYLRRAMEECHENDAGQNLSPVIASALPEIALRYGFTVALVCGIPRWSMLCSSKIVLAEAGSSLTRFDALVSEICKRWDLDARKVRSVDNHLDTVWIHSGDMYLVELSLVR